MYRVGLEAILGFTKRGDNLEIRPRVPRAWPGFRVDYRFGRTDYDIEVRCDGGREVTVDGLPRESGVIPLVDDGTRHTVRVRT
jgi:cellobiose phosphorylase